MTNKKTPNNKKIGVIGFGYVGKGAVNLFKDHYEVRIYDPYNASERSPEGRQDIPSAQKEEINQCDLGVICVPTPMAKDKSCDVSIVSRTAAWLKTPLILIKSTVAPGTTDYLKEKYKKRIVFSPEFMGESKYWSPYKFDQDMKECPFVILGGDKKDTGEILDILAPILGPTKFYYQCAAKEAEVIKYMENTYFGVKVTFANEMRKICEALGVDYWAVRTGWALDPRIDPMHTAVFKEKPGFGGKCLPKDINALVKASEKAGYKPKFLKQVLASNKEFRKNLFDN